jgi:hypothetical protein
MRSRAVLSTAQPPWTSDTHVTFGNYLRRVLDLIMSGMLMRRILSEEAYRRFFAVVSSCNVLAGPEAFNIFSSFRARLGISHARFSGAERRAVS